MNRTLLSRTAKFLWANPALMCAKIFHFQRGLFGVDTVVPTWFWTIRWILWFEFICWSWVEISGKPNYAAAYPQNFRL